MPSCSCQRRFEGFPSYIIPISGDVSHLRLREIAKSIHVDRAFLLKYLRRLCSLVVESYICTELLHERDFLIGACRRDHFEAIALRELDDETKKATLVSEHWSMKRRTIRSSRLHCL